MADVIIKGEVHASRGDFEEERDLLAEGVDTLIVEGSKEETGIRWLHGWFGAAMLIFEYLFTSFLYTDHQTLIDIAKGQGADVVYTRESDAALIENSHKVVVGAAFVLFYTFIFTSAIIGLVGPMMRGAGMLLMAGLGPILLLRLHETRKSGDNRDKKIADKIAAAAEDGGRIVAVMGASHAKRVPNYLPEEVDPEVKDPEYSVFSIPMGRDLAVPTVRLVGFLGIVYPVFLASFELYYTLLV